MADGTNESLTKRLMFQVFFFLDFLQNSLQKSFIFIFFFFYEITKIKIKSFECPKSLKSIKKNNTWNIRLLVDDSFVPSSKQPSIIYCRLTYLKSDCQDCSIEKKVSEILHYTLAQPIVKEELNTTMIRSRENAISVHLTLRWAFS